MSGYLVRLNLITRRFRCRNRDCQRQTFAERWGEWLHPYAHKMSRANDVLYRVAQVARGQGGQRLVRHLKMMASRVTLNRLLREQALPKIQTTCVLEVDDWTICRERTDGTILVDSERSEAVELFPDRQAETIAEWLCTHPNVQIIARDRSTEYAHGTDLGAPHVQQVADRWHLLLNMRQMLERYLRQIYGSLKLLSSTTSAEDDSTALRREPFIRTKKELQESQESLARRWKLYQEIQRRRQEGESILGISKALSLHRETLRTFYYAEQFPERSRHVPKPSILE